MMKGHLYTVSSRNAFESVQERWTVTRSGVCGPSRNFSHIASFRRIRRQDGYDGYDT